MGVEHAHTTQCADMSRYALVQVQVMVPLSGRSRATIAMKASGACWSDLEVVWRGYTSESEGSIPRSAEEAAAEAVSALLQAFPPLF